MTGKLPEKALPDGAHVVILTCSAIDEFGHNAVFAEEIAAGLAACGVATKFCDYRHQVRTLTEALRDPACIFLMSFNGFGAELAVAGWPAGDLVPAYEVARKPLFDLMHDSPAHDIMAHQVLVRSPWRHLLVTDHGYAQEAAELGFPSVRHVRSITFPRTLPRPMVSSGERRIPVLLPIRLPRPEAVAERFDAGSLAMRAVWQALFDLVTERCVEDLSLDARVETRLACRDAGIIFDIHDISCRFLLTAITDQVKFARRQRLVHALRHLPVTLVTDRDVAADTGAMTMTPARSFADLLRLMAESRIVICPLPHMTGWHERGLGAFTAGAAVVSAPNERLESVFRHGQDLLFYSSADDAAAVVEALLADPARLASLAETGHARAMDACSPRRLAETMLSSWRLRHERVAE